MVVKTGRRLPCACGLLTDNRAPTAPPATPTKRAGTAPGASPASCSRCTAVLPGLILACICMYSHCTVPCTPRPPLPPGHAHATLTTVKSRFPRLEMPPNAAQCM